MHTNMIAWETGLVILAIYLGFAGAWGALARHPFSFRIWLAVGFGLFVILPASLGLPFSVGAKLLAWGIALGVAGLFYLEPARFPAWMWKPRFILYYCGAVMFLILLWAALTATAGYPLARLWLGLPAGVAGCLAIVKACRRNHQRGAV